MSEVRIRLLGDVVPIDKEVEYSGLSEGDLTVFNLEAAVCPGLDSRPKAGPHLLGSPRTLAGFLSAFSRPVGSFANNHAMDWGWAGIRETVNVCSHWGGRLFGIGDNLREARRPLLIELNGITVGLVGCCETEYGVAQLDQPGVCPLDSSLFEQVRALRRESDIVIVSVHGGPELCPWPFPEHQMTMKALVDAGATIVHGHHPHVPQGYEHYKGSIIFYSLGNFLVDPLLWCRNPNSLWSITPLILWSDGAIVDVRRDTSVCEESGSKVLVRKSTSRELALHIDYISKAIAPLSDALALAALAKEHSVRMFRNVYSRYLIPSGGQRWKRFMSLASGMFGGSSAQMNEIDELLWYHLFSCESHRLAIRTGLGIASQELDWEPDEDLRRLYDEMCGHSG